MRCNFPSPFQQSLVNTVCGETRASPAFPQSREGSGGAGARGGALGTAHLAGADKSRNPGPGCCSCCCCGSPGTTDAPPGGVGVAAEGALCCAAGGGGCAGRARAAPRGSIRGGLSCGGRGSEGTTRHYGSGRRDAAPSGLRRHRSNLGEGQAGGPRRSRRATGAGGAQQPRSPGPAPPRPRARKVSRRACPRMRGAAAAGAVPAGPEPGCGWSAFGRWRAGHRRDSPGLRSACLQGTSHTERGKEIATGTDAKIRGRCVRSSSCFKNPPYVYLIAVHACAHSLFFYYDTIT